MWIKKVLNEKKTSRKNCAKYFYLEIIKKTHYYKYEINTKRFDRKGQRQTKKTIKNFLNVMFQKSNKSIIDSFRLKLNT